MKNLFTLTILLFGYFLNAQNGAIIGKVIDNENTPQEFVNVLLLNASDSSLVKGVVTNFEGEFEIEKIKTGDYLISATMVGFNDTYSSVLKIDNNKIDLGTITLSEGVELSEVTVTAKKPFIEMKADKLVVNVENSAVNAGNSALEVLEKSPGVTLDKDNNISLRGKQGVLVMINGKNQYMSGEDLTRMLESMPAENIVSIEIIANPSSKYDAEGNSGIINIKLKKNENLGYNGSVNAGFRQGVKTTWNTGLDFNYRAEKINVFGSGSYYDWGGYNDFSLQRVIPFQGGETSFDQASLMEWYGVSLNGKIGLDYYLSDKTTVGVLYKNNSGVRNWLNDNMTTITGDNAPGFDVLMVDGDQRGDWSQQSFNANLVHNIDDEGTSISFDADYSRYNSDGLSLYDNTYEFFNGQMAQDPFHLRNDQFTTIDIFASQVDFSRPTSSGYKFDMGAKVSFVRTDNDTKFEALINDTWTNQVNRSNNFIYTENVYAAYANVSKAFGKASFNAGLRVEHTFSDGNSVTLDQQVIREYTNFFPSVSLSHPVGENHSLSYTYSKRLNRPNYQSLNPFVEYLDDYTFERGNPFLNPQYSDAFGINYGFKNFLYVSANYSYTKDAITQVLEQVSEDNLTYQTEQNLDNFNSASLTVSSPIPFGKIGGARVNLTSFYNDFRSAIPSGSLSNQSIGYNIYIGNQFNLPAGITMELSGNYRSGLVYGLFEINPQYGLDFGLSKKVLNGKGNIKIGLDDIFKTRIQQVNVLQDDLNVQVNSVRDTRRAKINFSYNFGNNKVKAARRRTTATDDATSRISSDNN